MESSRHVQGQKVLSGVIIHNNDPCEGEGHYLYLSIVRPPQITYQVKKKTPPSRPSLPASQTLQLKSQNPQEIIF